LAQLTEQSLKIPETGRYSKILAFLTFGILKLVKYKIIELYAL
jgi:hypothetical protein